MLFGDLGLLTGEHKDFDEVAAKVAAAFGTPIALVTLVDDKYQRWPGAVGLPPRLDACRLDARETSICGHVVAANDMLVIEDVAKDTRFANNPFLIENGIRFYAGAPLRIGRAMLSARYASSTSSPDILTNVTATRCGTSRTI